MQKPELITNVDLTALSKICKDYIDFVASRKYHEDNDFKHYIYEVAMETFFGKDVFNYINKRKSNHD
jgi:hypothetical protein